MKAIDELIEKYFDKDESLLSDEMCDKILKDLEQLKAELNEQHKKDVVEAYIWGCYKETESNESEDDFYMRVDDESEQYYNQNH
jgi:NAD-dependent DNA ligase